jgi:hypothetical protein
MNAKYEFLGASALFLIIVGLAVVFVINVRANMGGLDLPPTPTPGPGATEMDAAALPPFPAHIDIFDEPWKPEPTPTPVVLPTPTPTETPVAVWDVVLIIGDAVQIRDENGGLHYLGEGDTFKGCTIEKVDWKENIVRVRNNADGRVKTLRKTGR